jgi:RNA polymerase sigma-70 factor (ECF subfamily)
LSEQAFVTPERGADPPSGIRRRSDLLARRSSLTLLAERAQDCSDQRELTRLVRTLEPGVRRTCVGVLGRAHAELEDALQECLLEIVRALPHYRFQGDFLHYANTISLRVAVLTRRRYAERHRRCEVLSELIPEPTPVAPERDRAGQLRRALEQLPVPQAEALSLHFVMGFSVDELAALTRVSPNTVKTRIRLGKRRIQRRLRPLSG